ncbi:dihydrofolate reductase [Paenibacillus crassostreae]|uniref:Dihydrofolate reductase n=1 Tax=Paenibacillus crassostreae TaxID=1763538 RepID=A0A167DTB0_9BACL|nr:dihydrofolate reductase [Paenibacillus crassostreae]AOZ91089.1 dihydrofolate reductase [Paenibacillus crassostreae]OAB74751.1 dihydrofolate reductase [Paenibacillus crassostreae]
MSITMIWAMDRNGVMGKDNGLPWRLPRDMAFFKQETINKPIVMGRKTWESFNGKPLKDRINIIMTRDQTYEVQGAHVIHTVEDALNYAKDADLMVIGGAQIYTQWLPYADRLLVTRIDEEFEGDITFPEIDWTAWTLTDRTKGIQDEQNPYEYYFCTYLRK